MSHPIDAVITTLPNSNKGWLARCINSLKDEPVNIYFVNGLQGCVGYGRAKSIGLGLAKYMAFIDHDDEVVPGIFSRIAPLLQSGTVHIYTDQALINSDGKFMCYGWSRDINTLKIVPGDLLPLLWDEQNKRYMHHLNVFLKEAAQDFLPQLYMGHRGIEGKLFQHIGGKGTVKYLPEVGYLWRIHPNGGSQSW